MSGSPPSAAPQLAAGPSSLVAVKFLVWDSVLWMMQAAALFDRIWRATSVSFAEHRLAAW
jgi:hypothetical protein